MRARARDVLELVPGLLGDGADRGDGAPIGSGAASIASSVDRVAQLESLMVGLAATSSLARPSGWWQRWATPW